MADGEYDGYGTGLVGQKRRRVGHGGEFLFAADRDLSIDLTSQAIYDPVRDNHSDGFVFEDLDLMSFEGTGTNESSLWYPDQGQQLYPESYIYDDQTFNPPNQALFSATSSYSTNLGHSSDNGSMDLMLVSTGRTSVEPSPTLQAGEKSPEALQVICFGMIADIPVYCNQSGSLLVESASLPLNFVRPSSLQYSSMGRNGEFGKLEERTAKIFANLLAEKNILIQLYTKSTGTRSVTKGTRGKKSGPKISQSLVNAVVYGSEDLCEPIGQYLTKCQIFLQDPMQSDRDVVYRNPHILSRTEGVVLISELSIESNDSQAKGLNDPCEFFSELSRDDHLSLTEAPDAVCTKLYPHQKKALTFMMQREQAWTFEGLDGDLWEKQPDEAGGILYRNSITGTEQSSQPKESRGGLLADKMGLGKSLTMISLIALNPTQCNEYFTFVSDGPMRRVKSTLLIVPYSLLKTWDDQLRRLDSLNPEGSSRLIVNNRHLKRGALSWIRFHRPKKRTTLLLSTYDIVITTYETLVSQHKKHRNPKNGDTLFSFVWHRIVLDEAHTIRNRATSMAKACCAIIATHRWAMTGTPIQNRITDFASILEYLDIHPFSKPKIFEAEIMKPCLDKDDPDISRMRKLVTFISLCRTKAVIDLPKRKDDKIILDFSPAEREYYDEVKYNTIQRIDDALSNNPLAPNQYLNALQWLNELRLICNHGRVHSRKVTERKLVATTQNEPWNHKTAGKAFETLVKAGQAQCELCHENITEGTGEAANSEFHKPSLSKCLTLICGSCIQIKVRDQKVPSCCCTPKCPKVDVSWAPESAEPKSDQPLSEFNLEEASTKLKKLLKMLQQSPKDEKSVVFSYWTFTLDLIEKLLHHASISFTRIDGKQTGDQRDNAIQKFESDGSIQVMLVSITCGGTGLDLTAASVAYLLEPQWNPMIEEQALCRIHRLGQTKEVRTVRFRIRDSFEEKIESIQKEKKDLAALAFSVEDRAEAADRVTRLHMLGESLRDR